MVGDCERLLWAVRTKIKLKAGSSVELHAVEGEPQRVRIVSFEPESIGADRAGEHDLQSVRPAREILEGLGIGFARIGIVEARHDAPWSAGAQGPGTVRWLIDGFDAEAVDGAGHELVEARPFEGRLGGLSPVGLGPSREYRRLRNQCRHSVR